MSENHMGARLAKVTEVDTVLGLVTVLFQPLGSDSTRSTSCLSDLIASASSVEVFARMSETAEATRCLFKLSYFEAAARAEYFVPPGLPSKTKVSALRN